MSPTGARLSVLAIDPGSERSAWIHLVDDEIHQFGFDPNAVVLQRCAEAHLWNVDGVAIEMIASYGMSVGREVFETCKWIGRFQEALVRCSIPEDAIAMVYRQEVKLNLCHSPKANDSTIRQALIDRYGPGKEKAIGNKKAPGPLYAIKADVWSSLAIAVTWLDRQKNQGAVT